jgi:hypothetical protein
MVGGRGGLGFDFDLKHCAVILEQSMGARNLVGIGLSYPPARLHRLAESIPWNRFLGSLKVKKNRLRYRGIQGSELNLVWKYIQSILDTQSWE